MLTSISYSRIQAKRRTNYAFLDTTVAASISVSVTPQQSCSVNIIFSAAVTGTITISGTYDSSSITETLTISSNTVAGGFKLFDTLTSVAFSAGIVSTGGTVSCRFTSKDGGNIVSISTLVSDFPVHLNRTGGSFPSLRSGGYQSEKPKALLPYTDQYTPKDGDLWTISSTNEEFIVTGVPLIEQIGISQHWIVHLEMV